MGLYLILFTLSFALAICKSSQLHYANGVINNRGKHDVSTKLLLLLFACVSGFRYELGGTDYDYYRYAYEMINGLHDFGSSVLNSQYEVGYTAFMYLCANVLHLSYEGSLVVEAFVFYILMYVGLKRYMPNWGIFLMFFMYKMFFYVTFVAMRQAFTVAGFYLLIRYLDERKVFKYYLSLLLVSSFHYGALLLFVLYPLFGIKINKRRLIVLGTIFGLSTVLSNLTGSLLNVVVEILGMSQLEDKAAGYSTDGASLSILYTLEYFLLFILMVKNYDVIKRKFKKSDFAIKWFLMVLPIVTLFRSTIILVRELPYFYPAYAVLFYYVYTVSCNKKLLYSGFSLICLLGIIKYVIQFDNGHFMLYKTWLFNPSVNFFQ